ncbi:restriction endonuclease [Klosneuvirus KNV1]|uniref:Restriction endonuclease n=1 Tax=Klosneuvirus KNV1 TaxID=1977640 RepID=A0A1V0SLG6_9VIRU|nr:restriction endonuclease [Klosneuvirus KNV1]
MLPTTKTCTSEGKNIGKYRFYNSSQTMKLYLDTYEIDKESIIIGNGGNVNIHYDTYFTPTKHVTVCHIKDKNMYNTKCIYYYLYLNIHKLISKSDGGGLKWLNKTNIASIIIPTLSLSHQKEIVELLDKEFQKYDINKLSNAINDVPIFNLLINKQYEDFTDLLYMIYKKIEYDGIVDGFEKEKKATFKFELMRYNCEEKKLGDIVDITTGKLDSGDFKNIGNVPFYSGKPDNPIGTHDSITFNYPEYILMIKGGGCPEMLTRYDNEHVGMAKVFLVNGPSAVTNGLYCMKIKENGTKLSYKFLYNYLKFNKNTIVKLSKFGTRLGNIPMFNIIKLCIKIPSLEDQNKLLKHIENLEILNNNLVTIRDKVQETIDGALEYIKNTKLKMEEEKQTTVKKYPLSSFTEPLKTGMNQTITSPTKTKEFKYPYYTPEATLYSKTASFNGKHLLITRVETNQGTIQAVDSEFSASSGIYVIKLEDDYESYYDIIKEQLENDFDFKKLIEEQPIIVKGQKSKLIGKTHLEDFIIKIQEESTEENQVESDEEKPIEPSEEHQDEQLDESSEESIKEPEEKPKEIIPQKSILNPKSTITTKPQNNTKTQTVKPLNQKVVQNAKKKNITIA